MPLQAVTLSIVEDFTVTSPLQYHCQRNTALPPPKSHSIAIASSLSIVEEFAITSPLQYLARHAALRLPYNHHRRQSLSPSLRSSPSCCHCKFAVNTTPPHCLEFSITLPLQAVSLSIVKEFAVTFPLQYCRQRHTATPPSHLRTQQTIPSENPTSIQIADAM